MIPSRSRYKISFLSSGIHVRDIIKQFPVEFCINEVSFLVMKVNRVASTIYCQFIQRYDITTTRLPSSLRTEQTSGPP